MHGVKLGILLLAFIVSLDIQAAPSQQAVALAGEWRGDSVCQVRPSACNDEKALYRVATVEGKPDRLAITFAKVVDGRTVVMGTIDDCHYDSASGTIRCEYSRGVWLLQAKDNKMEGTLTLPDKTVLRRVTLEKQP